MAFFDVPDIEEIILTKITNIFDLYNRRHVCHSWRSVVDCILPSVYLHLLAYGKRGKFVESVHFLNLFSRECRVGRVPMFRSVNGQLLLARRVYSSHRWLVLDCTACHQKHHKNDSCDAFLYNSFCRGYYHICIYNMFTRDRIRLLGFPLNFLDGCQVSKRKFIVSYDAKKHTCIGVAIRDGQYLRNLMFFKLEEEEWTMLVEEPMQIVDITSYQGRFWVIEDDLKLIQFDSDLGTIVPDLRLNHVSSSYPNPDGADQFLVESLCGDLLLVQLNIWDDNRSVKVFKMDWKRKEFKPSCVYFNYNVVGRGHKGEIWVYELGSEIFSWYCPFFFLFVILTNAASG